MVTIQQRISFIAIFGFLALTIFAFSDKPAYGDVLFIGETHKAPDISTALDDEMFTEDFEADALVAGDERLIEDGRVKAENPVTVLFTAIKEKLRAVSTAKDVALRDINSAAVSNGNQWPFALAGLLFIMLMMRFKRRAKKSKF